ncbi:hypothetical protein KP79_PYT25923 [Mizuhopecten yessoensis]|uniref:Uncharacterized protein n=1 Tax=Mizuhopecten yessoensis TaxID=6573 RepID=A0A210QI55_MIZYE|nr:hypothetical protein KP79_PYT25923 [Mizuhopecten yessoensis]
MIQTKTLQYIGTPMVIEFDDVGVLNEMSSPRMFATHLTYPFIPKDLCQNILRIADFLEVDHEETFLRNVERTVTFENL